MSPSPQEKHREPAAARGISSKARKFELKPLAVVAGVAATVLMFFLFAEAVMDGATRSFDEGIMRALREPGNMADPIGPLWFEEMVRDVTALGSTFVLTFAVIVVASYLWLAGAPQKAAFLIAAVLTGSWVNRLLKLSFARPRPDIAGQVAWLTPESFPSGHTANSAIVYLTLGMMLARIETSYAVKVFIFGVCVAVTLMIGMSRVYLGVHWPTDVLAGWAVGACWAFLCWYALVWLQPSGTRQ